MSLVAFKPKQHPQQRARAYNDAVNDRALPAEVFARLHARFNFTVDAAASERNAKLPRFWTRSDDGLAQSWAGERVYCNPPYSDIEPWLEKARAEVDCPLIVFLLPANRTEQGWWHRHVEPFRDRGGMIRTEFLANRQRFIAAGADCVKPNERPPFGVVLVVFERRVS